MFVNIICQEKLQLDVIVRFSFYLFCCVICPFALIKAYIPNLMLNYNERTFIYICQNRLWNVLSRFSRVQLFLTPWTVAHHAPLSMGFSTQVRKRTGVGCHALLQGIFLTQGSNLSLLMSSAAAQKFFTTSAIWEILPLMSMNNRKELIISSLPMPPQHHSFPRT